MNKISLSETEQKIIIDKELIKIYNLDKWANNFNLMTAGYRDKLDPKNISSPDVSFNLVTLAILGEAKARVFKKQGNRHVHIGGETRPHTQEFISLLSRIYAFHGYTVHLRKELRTTPIWYSSFGVFYNGCQSGDNLTASHSQYFKGGWKPMDSFGKQIVNEEEDIISEVKKIVREKAEISLTPKDSKNIVEDFDVDEEYIEYIKSIVSEKSIDEIRKAAKNDFCCSICTMGGSMKKTTEQLFEKLGIRTGKTGIIRYYLSDEDSRYHNIGQINGNNYGVDPTKPEVYKNVSAKEKIMSGEANIVFLWDPDGDRFNMVTKAPKSKGKDFEELGLNVEYPGNKDCIVYFTPNQIYFMLAAYQIETMKETGVFGKFDWFIATTVPSTHMLEELAKAEKIKIIHQQVGFKHWGSFVEWFDKNKEKDYFYTTCIGEKVIFGKNSRFIIMCEESGGAALGGTKLLKNKSKTKEILGICEKDGFQIGLTALCLASRLFNEKSTFAEHYAGLIKKHNIKNVYYKRHDRLLYNEALSGKELSQEKEKGFKIRDEVINFFRNLAVTHKSGKTLEEISDVLKTKIREGDARLPKLKKISLIGPGGLIDGTYFVFESFWFVIRASGTDALLRYYVEGKSKEEVDKYIETLVNLKI